MGFRKSRFLKFFQVSLNSLRNSNLGAFGGPWLRLHGPSCHCVGPHGWSSTCIVTKRLPKTIPGAKEGFQKNSNSEKIFR